MRVSQILLLALSAALFSTSSAYALESRYTDTFNDSCKLISEYEAGATHRCEAWGLYYDIMEGDLRFTLAFGIEDFNEPKQEWRSFGNFNYVGDKIEWLFEKGREEPLAAINRYYLDNQEESGNSIQDHQILTVYKVSPGDGACHVAYVDVRANKKANELAREAAERLVPGFACGEDRALWYGDVPDGIVIYKP